MCLRSNSDTFSVRKSADSPAVTIMAALETISSQDHRVTD